MSAREHVAKEIARMADLPVVSRILLQLNRVAANERASADDLSEVIIRDQALAVRVLRAVNSSFYRKQDRPPITTISKAVVLLGFNEVRRLALGMAVFEYLRRGAQLTAGRRIGGRSLLTAVVARHMAGRIEYEPVEEAFVAGLIRDMGKLVLLRCAPQQYAELIERAPDDAWLQLKERKIFGVTHEQAGRMLARKWDLPTPLCAALGDDSAGGHRHAQLRHLAEAAKMAAAHLAEDPSGRSLDAQLDADERFHGLSAGELRDLAGPITLDFTEMVESLGVEDVLVREPEPAATEPSRGTPASRRLDRAQILDRLAEVNAALLAAQPATDPLQLTVNAVHTVLGVPRVLLWRIGDGGRTLTCAADRGWAENLSAQLDPVPLRENTSLLARCLLEKRPLHLENLEAPGLVDGDRELMMLLRSGPVDLVPLVDRDRPRGVLWLDAGRSRGALDAETLAAVQLFAQALTLALSRARGAPVPA
jgi:HD-like signal output (HDOD) protein